MFLKPYTNDCKRFPFGETSFFITIKETVFVEWHVETNKEGWSYIFFHLAVSLIHKPKQWG